MTDPADRVPSASEVRLRLLGTVTLETEAGPAVVQSGRVSTLASLLGLTPGRVVSTDRLMEQLWHDEPPRTGPATLHVYVSRLRKQLETAGLRVLTRSPGYVLDVADAQVDVSVLVAALASAEQAASDGDHSTVLDLTGSALALWRGDPFGGAAPCPDLSVETDRLDEQSARLRELRAESLLALGRAGEAGALAKQLSERAPLDERYWALRMRAAVLGGRTAAALALFDEFRDLLDAELGLDPGEDLQRLHVEILRGSARPAAPAETRQGSPAPSNPLHAEAGDGPRDEDPSGRGASSDAGSGHSSPSLVGRDIEQAAMTRAAVAASTGSGQVVVVEGEPGIGKTALAECAAATAREVGVDVIWTRAVDGPGTPPMWMWEQILRHLARRGALENLPAGDDGPGASPLAALAAESGDEQDAERSRFRLSEALVDAVVDASRSTPRLLVFDDLQWADDGTLHALRMLAQAVRHRALSVVITARTTGARSAILGDILTAVGREGGAIRILLDPLSVTDVAALAGGVGAEAAGELHERSGGNPFYLQELLRHGGDGVPEGVAGLLHQRLQSFPEDAREALRAAAVVGRRIDLPLLAALHSSSPVEVLRLLQPAIGEGIVTASGTPSFAHDLARDAVLQTLTLAERVALHARIADAIEAVHADDPDWTDALADHRFESVLGSASDAAFAACTAAADLAADRRAYDQAALQRSRALATLPQRPDTRRTRFDVLMRLTTERRLAGDVLGASTTLTQAIDLARRLDDRELLTEAVSVLGGVTMWNWRQFNEVDHETVAILEDLLAEEGPSRPSRRERAELLGTLGVELYYSDRRDRGEAYAREAVAIARDLGDPALLGRALNNLVISSWEPYNNAERLAALDEALEMSGKGLPLHTEVIARMHRAPLLMRLGEVAAVAEELDRAEWLAPRVGLVELEGQIWVQRVSSTLLGGDPDGARDMVERGYHLYRRTSLWGADWVRLSQLAMIARMEGDPRPYVDQLVTRSADESYRTLRWTALVCLLDIGEYDEARRLQERWGMRTLPRRIHWGSDYEWIHAAELSLALGAPDPADVYAALAPLRSELADCGSGIAVWGPVADWLSRLASAMGDEVQAGIDAQTARDLSDGVREALGRPPYWLSRMR